MSAGDDPMSGTLYRATGDGQSGAARHRPIRPTTSPRRSPPAEGHCLSKVRCIGCRVLPGGEVAAVGVLDPLLDVDEGADDGRCLRVRHGWRGVHVGAERRAGGVGLQYAVIQVRRPARANTASLSPSLFDRPRSFPAIRAAKSAGESARPAARVRVPRGLFGDVTALRSLPGRDPTEVGDLPEIRPESG